MCGTGERLIKFRATRVAVRRQLAGELSPAAASTADRRRHRAVHAVPYRRRLTGSVLAHLFKATAQQRHRALAATIARLVPAEAVVFDVGAHAGQYTKLFARAASAGRVYAVEPGSYARSILRAVVWLHRLGNVSVLPMALGEADGLDTLSVPGNPRCHHGLRLSHPAPPQNPSSPPEHS